MGLRVSILRNTNYGDCSNGGVSAYYDNLTIINVDGPFEPTNDSPAAILKKGNLRGTVVVVPERVKDEWTMMGGCYVATCDSRFTNVIEKITENRFYGAVPLHDRVE